MTGEPQPLPPRIRDEEHLEELLSEPTPAVLEALRRLDGDIVVLGVAGKMGLTLARMARRAFDILGMKHEVTGVARFSRPEYADWLIRHGIEPLQADLLEPTQLETLPDAPGVVFMAGMKFGATGNEPLTWAMNSFLPGVVCRRYRQSKLVAFSTGNVYGLTPAVRGGSCEPDLLQPVGEYAMSCLGRERIIEHFSREFGMPAVLLRLNYAVEMRYGVLLDIAQKVVEGEPVELGMGAVNVIWQGDANAMALASFSETATPAKILNLAGPELLGVRQVAEHFGRLFGKPPCFKGAESADALLSNGQECQARFGYPRVGVRQVMEWVADWVQKGGSTLGKPTRFENREGQF